MRTYIVIIALFLSPVVIAGAATLNEMKLKYTQVDATIESTHSAAKKKALSSFGKALDFHLEKIKKQGDIDAYTVMNEEKERFSKSKTVPESSTVIDPRIIKIAIAYEQATAKAQRDANSSHIVLLKRYISALEALVAKLMRADKMADARSVKDELDGARFMLADHESKTVMNQEESKAPESIVRNIRLVGSGIQTGKWRKQTVRVTKGSKVTISAEAIESLKKIGYSHDCFWLKLGENGAKHRFDTKGRRNWSTRKGWHYAPDLSLTADANCYIYVCQNQMNRLTLTVTIEPSSE